MKNKKKGEKSEKKNHFLISPKKTLKTNKENPICLLTGDDHDEDSYLRV